MVSLAEKSSESTPVTRETPLAEEVYHAIQARGDRGDEEWSEVSLGDGRQVAVAAHCLRWEDLLLLDSLDLTDARIWCWLHKSLEERGMDSGFAFFDAYAFSVCRALPVSPMVVGRLRRKTDTSSFTLFETQNPLILASYEFRT